MIDVRKTYCEEVNAITHTTPHHADDVFATVMLSMLFPVVLFRTRDKTIIGKTDAVVYDVGGEFDSKRNRFDHHQRGFSEARPNGVKYSSAGLIWRKYGAQIVKKVCEDTKLDDQMITNIAARVDRSLVSGIDARDNGQSDKESVMSIASIIAMVKPHWYEKDADGDSYFLKACELAEVTLKCVIDNAMSAEYGCREVWKILKTVEGQIIIMDQFIGGWAEAILKSDIIKAAELVYAVFPSANGNWNAHTIPKSTSEPKEARKRFPESWCGLSDEELAKITGVETAVFCHKDGFIAGAKTREDAILLAQKAIDA